LSASSLPAGGTASFNPAVISSGSATLSVTTSVTTPTGNYLLTIMGEAPGQQHTTQATLAVSAAPGTATGKVSNAATGAPISGAKVTYGTNSATTDASGNYSLGNLPAGSLQLTASATGYLNTVQTVTITPGGTTTANFVLITVTGTITGRITNASTGAGLAGATVSYNGGSTKSDTNGNYTLSAANPGTYTVTATLTGWVTESTSVTVVSGGTVTGNIKLATGGKAAGKVTNKSGAAISGATVKVTGGIVPTTVTVTTNSTGNYDSGWVPIGNYSITVSKSGFTTQTKNTTVTTGGTVTVNFTMQ
jgi:large repetitive protein